MEHTHASLFSGIGGAELAASWMGWTNVFHCEIQEFQRKVLEYWFPNSISYEDITKTDFTEWRGRIDILTGGFPCQPFSVAGKRKGAEDNRYLWGEMLRAIRQIQPTWVVGENVNGILSMVQSCNTVKVGRTDDLFEENYIYRKEQQFTIDVICEDLEHAGYSVQPIVIPACAVGAPHRRDRVWMLPTVQTQGLKICNKEGKTEFLSPLLLPTPTAIDKGSGRINKSLSKNATERPTLAKCAKMQLLPTLNASEGTKWTTKYNANSQMGKGLTAMACSGLLLTPMAKDGMRSGMTMDALKKHGKPKANLAEQIAHKVGGGTSQLNPLYVEEMMGYPLEWLTLPFLSQNGEVKALKR